MTTGNFEFIAFEKNDVLQLTSTREGEVKLGERVEVGLSLKAEFVLIGIQEDIGPQANFGNPGAKNAFPAMITRFLNMQSTSAFSGENLTCAGYIQQLSAFSSIEQSRKLVEELDDLLINLLVPIYKNNQVPILVGGGHNNAFPLIAAFFKAHNHPLEVINCDPHADCRKLEGRHSGNSFSYAKELGFLSSYSVLGLHRAYNSENMMKYMKQNDFYYSFFEEYMNDSSKMADDIHKITSNSDDYLGVELDLDSIKNMPSSAFTPSGLEVEQARLYVMSLASSMRKVAYLNLPEGAPMNENEEKIVGKTLAYLVHDFVSNANSFDNHSITGF